MLCFTRLLFILTLLFIFNLIYSNIIAILYKSMQIIL